MEDWQNQMKTLSERAKYILNNKALCDCTFSFGKEEIKCHKLILASASPVFEAMFFGLMPQEIKPISITDIEPDIFLQVVGYIYQDKVEITSFKNACDIYHAAKKYILIMLEKTCIEYLINHLDTSNVIHLYEFAKFHNEEKLEKYCRKEIQLNTSNIMKSEYIIYATEKTLSTILDLNRLNISSELELISAIERWAAFECSKKGQDETIRSVAGDLVKKLRFLTVTKNEFIRELASSALLNDSEKLSVLLRILQPDLPAMNNGLCEIKVKRKPCKAKSVSVLNFQEIKEARCDGSEWLTSIFTISSHIDLLGVELNLQVSEIGGQYTENLMVKIGLANKEDYFAEGNLFGLVKFNTKAQIMFNTIPTLEPLREYSMHIFLCCPGTYPMGRHTCLTCTNMNVEIDFVSHSSWERSHPWNTTVLSSIIYTDPL